VRLQQSYCCGHFLLQLAILVVGFGLCAPGSVQKLLSIRLLKLADSVIEPVNVCLCAFSYSSLGLWEGVNSGSEWV